MAKRTFTATSTFVIGTNEDEGATRLIFSAEGMGAGDILKVTGKPPGAVTRQPVALRDEGTLAVIAGATGATTDGLYSADISGLDAAFSYTKGTNNADVYYSQQSGV